MRKMLTTLFSLSLVSVVSLAATHAGGWAIITVEDLPDHLVAKQPANLVFTVRQHGATFLTDLNPVVVARDGRAETKAVVTNRGKGQYSAALTLPASGEWTVNIRSGFMDNQLELLPIRALGAGEGQKVMAAADRGRHLFVAKGCASCHMHGSITQTRPGLNAPELTGRRYPPEYLAQFLANPTAMSKGNWKMPDLKLKAPEITALVTFINTESRTASSK